MKLLTKKITYLLYPRKFKKNFVQVSVQSGNLHKKLVAKIIIIIVIITNLKGEKLKTLLRGEI
jgi:hypothetical protein